MADHLPPPLGILLAMIGDRSNRRANGGGRAFNPGISTLSVEGGSPVMVGRLPHYGLAED